MAERLSLLDFLVEKSQWVVNVRWLLLIERSHAEGLVHGNVLATRRSVSIMGVVPETTLIQVTKVGHHSIYAAKEALILFDNKELLATTSQASNGFAKVLGQNLERAVCFLSADEDLTD